MSIRDGQGVSLLYCLPGRLPPSDAGTVLLQYRLSIQGANIGKQCWWLGQIFYVVTCVAAKLSIIITLLRITVERIYAWVLYGAIALATGVGLVFLFFTIFQCQPVDFFWNRDSEQGTCIDSDVLIAIAYLYSVGAAITDLTIGLLPVALIWNLRMSRRNKQAIMGILGIGCMCVFLKYPKTRRQLLTAITVQVLPSSFGFLSFVIIRTGNSSVCAYFNSIIVYSLI